MRAFIAGSLILLSLVTSAFVVQQTEQYYRSIGVTAAAPAVLTSDNAGLPTADSSVFDFLRKSPVVIVNNSPYFEYVAQAVHHSFSILGIRHTMATSIADGSNATFILFVTHESHLKLPHNYISYNFEQLTTDKEWPPQLFERLRGAKMVWDYSLENIEVLRAHNITNTYHIPLGYAETMENTVRPAEQRDIDVMFVGEINPRRQAMLQKIASLQRPPPGVGPLTTSFKSAWGEALLRLYRRSKLAVNIHYYGGRTILEVHRILPLIVSKVLVLSEQSHDIWLDKSFLGLVNYTTRNDVQQSVTSLLSIDIEQEAERRYQQLLRCCRYVDYFQVAFMRPYPLSPH